ncbi:MAG: hypothetical protein CM15mP84_07060 [Cellvibrionales bacterium]|nr:MAG: hypothetical protein CM15mP84_07060 [Cellvibrionales bacterium]
MRDLRETGADEYTWGETIAEIDRVAAWLEAEFGEGSVWRCSKGNRAHWVMADIAVIHSGNVTVPLSQPTPPRRRSTSSTSPIQSCCSWARRKTGRE